VELPFAIHGPGWFISPVIRLPILLCLLALLPSCRPPAAQSAQPQHRGSVWVVDREGRPGRLFLCGTIHILRQSDHPLAPGYDFAYQQSQKLIFELPPGASEAPEFSARLLELGQYPEDESLEASVSAETWEKLKAWVKSRRKSLASFNRFRPWLASLFITSEEYQALGASNDKGADQLYENLSRRDHKPGEGLENVELQLQLFSQLTASQQAEMLEQTLAEVSTLPQEYETMISAWKKGDIDTLHGLINREAEKYPELLEIFINRRNHAWIDRLDTLLSAGEKVMVLVGAGHLGGRPDGVLALLKTRGCRVRHISEVMKETNSH